MAPTPSEHSGRTPRAGSRSPRRKRLGVLLQVVLVLCLSLGIHAYQTRNLLKTDGEPAPALRLPALAGGEVDLADLRGRPVLVYFFAPWCHVC